MAVDQTDKNRIERLDVEELLRNLIRIPSYPGLPRQEEKVVQEVSHYLNRHDIEHRIDEVKPGRPNLIAAVRGANPGKRLLLCGHTDTVPPNKDSDADFFSAKKVDGRIFGRGAVDMKGALAAMAASLVLLQDNLNSGEVIFAAVIDEEMESLGAEHLIRSGVKAEGAIVGEPTENRIAIAHKGLEWLELSFIGKETHGGTSKMGVNAVNAAARFVHFVEQVLEPNLLSRSHPIMGPPTINLGTIHGGDQPSTVAGKCTIQLDRRWIPGESVDLVFGQLEVMLQNVRRRMPGLETRISRVPGGMATMVHGPLEIPKEHELVRAAEDARAEVYGEAGELTAFPAWTDGALLSREAGIPCIICGPADLSLAHSAAESIEIAEVKKAVEIYVKTARNFC